LVSKPTLPSLGISLAALKAANAEHRRVEMALERPSRRSVILNSVAVIELQATSEFDYLQCRSSESLQRPASSCYLLYDMSTAAARMLVRQLL
jgi:hypothetical protein